MNVPGPLKPYEAGAELVVAIVIAIAIAWGFVTIKGWHDAAQANGQTVQAQSAQLNTASQLSTDLGNKTQEAQKVDVIVHQTRDDYGEKVRQLKAYDPLVDDWSSSPVPARLLELARERRSARDRSAADTAWRAHDHAEAGSSGPDPAPGPGPDQ